MNNKNSDDIIKSSQMTLSVIAGCMVMSLVFYLTLATSGFIKPPVQVSDPFLSYILLTIAMLLFCSAPSIGRSVLILRLKNTAPADIKEVLAAYFISLVITYALWEGVGICGLIIFIVTGQLFYCQVLCFLAILAMILSWPRTQRVRAIIEQFATMI